MLGFLYNFNTLNSWFPPYTEHEAWQLLSHEKKIMIIVVHSLPSEPVGDPPAVTLAFPSGSV